MENQAVGVPSRWRRRAFALAAGASAIVLALVLAEVTIRLFVPEGRWRFRDAQGDWRTDPRLGWVHRPDVDLLSSGDGGRTLRFRTNQDGLQPGSARRERSGPRILLIGDSAIVGRAVPEEARVHVQLEERLRAAGKPFEVLNAGVQGYSTGQELLLLERLLPLYKPDVVLLCFCVNDLTDNVAGVGYGLPRPAFRLDPGGRIVEVPAENVPAEVPMPSGVRRAVASSAVYQLLKPALLRLRTRSGEWDALHADVVDLYLDPTALDRRDWAVEEALLRRVREVAVASGARFFAWEHPHVEEVWDSTIERLAAGRPYDRHALERRLARACAAAGVELVPTVDAFSGRQAEGPFHLLPRDPHCNEAGYRLQAELLAARLVPR